MINHSRGVDSTDIDIYNWHYRYVCKLCGFHYPVEFEPNFYDLQIQVCEECDQSYKYEWAYGIYKLVNQSKWYNPITWNKTEWLNKVLEDEKTQT